MQRSQPKVTLPRRMPSGVVTRMHPLLWCIEHRMPGGWTIARLAREIGVQGPTLHGWLSDCRRDRNFILPAIRARQLARVLDVEPAMFDPITFAAHWREHNWEAQ